MKISMHTMAVDSFVPMLKSLSEILEEGAAYAREKTLDLVNARLAPDMYTLAQQVELACHHATDGVSRLVGEEPQHVENNERTIAELKDRIAKTVDYTKNANPTAFEGAEGREIRIAIPGNMVIAMNGVQFLRSWALPHFYFHVVTAYDILRHNGVAIGKKDYLSQIGAFIRPNM